MPFEKHVLRQDLNIGTESVTECAWEIPASRHGSTLTSDPHYRECIPRGVKPLKARSTRAWVDCIAPAECGLVWALPAHSLEYLTRISTDKFLFFLSIWFHYIEVNQKKMLFRICNSNRLKKRRGKKKSRWRVKYRTDSMENVWSDEKHNEMCRKWV